MFVFDYQSLHQDPGLAHVSCGGLSLLPVFLLDRIKALWMTLCRRSVAESGLLLLLSSRPRIAADLKMGSETAKASRVLVRMNSLARWLLICNSHALTVPGHSYRRILSGYVSRFICFAVTFECRLPSPSDHIKALQAPSNLLKSSKSSNRSPLFNKALESTVKKHGHVAWLVFASCC